MPSCLASGCWERGTERFGVGVEIWSLVLSITVPELYFPLRKRLHNVDLEREVKNEKHIRGQIFFLIPTLIFKWWTSFSNSVSMNTWIHVHLYIDTCLYYKHTYAIFYMRDFKRVGTDGATCVPSVKKQRANGLLSFPREPSSPQARLASSGAAQPPGGCALLTRVRSGSSPESAPQPLTHPRPWRGDTTSESNYNPQLTYESTNLTEKGGKKTNKTWSCRPGAALAGTFLRCKNSLIGCSHAPARALHWLSRHATGARRGLGEERGRHSGACRFLKGRSAFSNQRSFVARDLVCDLRVGGGGSRREKKKN